MRMIPITIILVAACVLQPGTALWAGSIYIWTDPKHVVHLTEIPPPPGNAVDDVLNSPAESPPTAPASPQQPQSIGSWEIQQAEQQVRQATQRLRQAEKNAQEVHQEAERTIQESEQYIDSHDNNQYMRRAFKYQLRQARNTIVTSQMKAREAADQLKQAEQNAEAARQQLKETQEGSKITNKSN